MAGPSPGTPRPLTNEPFTLGVNLPWLSYGCDFGANAWFPDGGVGRAEGRARAGEVLARLARSGLSTVRWFLFCDGRAGIRFDRHGRPLGLDAFVFRDIDAALELSVSNRLTLIFVLLDFTWCGRGRVERGVSLGGRRRTIAHVGRRRMLQERVLLPVFERYGKEPGIAAWDLFNEPEWATFGYGGGRTGWPVLPRIMRGFLQEACAAAHAVATQPITVGLASARGLPLVSGCGLDLYQVHWYDRRERRSPLALPPLCRLDRPLLLGEFPSSGSARPVGDLLRTARASGYCGALAWSAAARDRFSSLAAIEQAAADLNPYS